MLNGIIITSNIKFFSFESILFNDARIEIPNSKSSIIRIIFTCFIPVRMFLFEINSYLFLNCKRVKLIFLLALSFYLIFLFFILTDE